MNGFKVAFQMVSTCVTLPFGYASFGRISGVASTIAGLVQLTMSEVVDRTERGGAPFPAGMSPKRRWQLVDFGLAVIPALLLVQPLTALLAGASAGLLDVHLSTHIHTIIHRCSAFFTRILFQRRLSQPTSDGAHHVHTTCTPRVNHVSRIYTSFERLSSRANKNQRVI